MTESIAKNMSILVRCMSDWIFAAMAIGMIVMMVPPLAKGRYAEKTKVFANQRILWFSF